MTTEERLEKLERKIEEMQNVIQTKALCVLDDQAQERIKLVMTEDGPRIGVMDENGKIRASLTVDTNGPRLLMRDENGNQRAGMGVGVGKFGPKMFMFDCNGNIIWQAP